MEAAIDDGLTEKQGKFAALVARGLNYSDAYAQVFKCKGMSQKTVNEKASRLAADGKVRARIRAILEEARVTDVDDAAVAFNDLLRMASSTRPPHPRRSVPSPLAYQLIAWPCTAITNSMH